MRCDQPFTLALYGISELSDSILDAFFEAGCDDATFSRRSGRVYATFSRESESLLDSICTAIHDVRKAGVGAEVLRVDVCNLVTQAEIARRVGRSRQLINQYVKGERGPGNFPPPACEMCEGQMLWYWCEVAGWLYENNLLCEDAFREATEVDALNAFLEAEYVKKNRPELAREISRQIGLGTLNAPC